MAYQAGFLGVHNDTGSKPKDSTSKLGATQLDTDCHSAESEAFKEFVFKPANFISSEKSKIRLRCKSAVSRDPPPPRGNFAYVDAPLKANRAVVVELSALKRERPVRIVLTVKDFDHVYSSDSLPKLCDTTGSLMMESEMPGTGDELAVRISSSGAVYVSHNNRGWVKRMSVDPNLEYHVVFDMEHILVLYVIGVASDLGELNASQIREPVVAPQVPRMRVFPECALCLENERDVAILPCYHVIACESCVQTLRKFQPAKCPMCRGRLADVKKLHIA